MMGRKVPLARRSLFQDRRRAVLAAGGVAAALLLVLLLDGIFAGAMRQVTAYLRSSPADVIVSQRGVRTMHMSVSALPPETVGAAERVDGVAWAEGIRFTSSTITSANGRELSYIIGYDPAGRGGPRHIVRGRTPRSGEAVVERVAADRLGIGVGGRVQVLGQWFRVSGLFRGGTSMINTTTFVTTSDYARLRGPAVAYVLVGAKSGVSAATLAQRVGRALPSTTVQTRRGFTHEEAAVVKDMSADVLQIMTIIGFLIALAVIALTLFTLTLSKLREHAIVKALGSANRGVGLVVFRQAVWSVATALVLATILAVVLGRVVGRVDPALQVTVEPMSVAKAGIGALVVGALGSIVPLRRVFKIDPASAFRRTS